jgi:hypothetical protein
MRLIAALERRLERLFERPAARLFDMPLRAVQLQQRLERAMEIERVVATGRVYAPDGYAVHVSVADLTALREAEPDLERKLADALVGRARQRGYYLARTPAIRVIGDGAVRRGEMQVGATVSGGERAGGRGPAPADATAVYRAPSVAHPLVDIVVREPTVAPRRVRLDGAIVRIGRAADNHLALGDPKVSRHHGELRMRRGTLIYRDLRSTNGSRVNGTRVNEMAVGAGDRIEVGDSSIVVEPV